MQRCPSSCRPERITEYRRYALQHPSNETWGRAQRCRPNAKVLGFRAINFGGLVNQMRLLGSALGQACDAKASLILDVWTTNFFPPGSREFGGHRCLPAFRSDLLHVAGPPVPWSTVVDYDRLNALLASLPRCRATRVEPPRCAAAGPVRCPFDCGLFDSPFADELLPQLPLAPLPCEGRPLPRVYHAVHLNLDVDWLLVNRHGIDTRDYWDFLSMPPARRNAFRERCCSESGEYADDARRLALQLARKVRALPPGPVFVATSIGKPGYRTLAWLLAFFESHLDGRRVVRCGGRGGREVSAARELAVVSGASHFVMHMNSTFSVLGCRRVQRRGGVCVRGFGTSPPELPLRGVQERW